MTLSWFDTKTVDALADELVYDLLRRIPPATLATGGKKSEAKQARTRELVLKRAAEFARTNTLNIYKKARLANRLKWALKEASYPATFVDEVAYELAATIATQKKQSA